MQIFGFFAKLKLLQTMTLSHHHWIFPFLVLWHGQAAIICLGTCPHVYNAFASHFNMAFWLTEQWPQFSFLNVEHSSFLINKFWAYTHDQWSPGCSSFHSVIISANCFDQSVPSPTELGLTPLTCFPAFFLFCTILLIGMACCVHSRANLTLFVPLVLTLMPLNSCSSSDRFFFSI